MDIDRRIKSFLSTGESIRKVLKSTHSKELSLEAERALFHVIPSAFHKNAWFSELSVRSSLEGLVRMLNESDMLDWLSVSLASIKKKKEVSRIGIVMAGNLPLVGFHDLLCVLLAGEYAVIKMSSDDVQLLPLILNILEAHDKSISDSYCVENKGIKNIDKIIATGSDNTARYFEYYFAKYPSVIRKSRTSVAVISENITDQKIKELAKDMFQYYGLGCRNVSKLFLPKGFSVPHLIDHLRSYEAKMDNIKYINNLEYHKSILLINGAQYLDGGFFLMRESNDLFSPVSITNYQFYDHEQEVIDYLKEHDSQIQCVVGQSGEVGFGQAQSPKLWDYADKIDVMKFLLD
ncbi:MAG: hypothetical protein ACJA0Q_000588 [Saprospiraceae bacterium]|jgi:hypothetical protein